MRWNDIGLANLKQDMYKVYNKLEFEVYNAGNVPVHPFEQELKIIISQIRGSTEYFELRNLGNGTVFRVNESVSERQTIIIDGSSITSNGLQFLRSTNKQFIELDPGWNQFKISGADSATVEFIYRFYYK